ncbi:MAG: prolyl oligopeptidase family serine peptidase [Alphaproteobacteria bacterium]|nr:prolyl oligopeptidase family serine peptidase [Alphaproteobacteria bacterium]
MRRNGIWLVGFLALLLGQSGVEAHASTSAEGRIDRNFTVAVVPGPKIPAIAASELKVSKGRTAVRIDSSNYELETLTVTPPGSGPFPLAVISHGTPTRGGKAAKKKLRIRMLLAVAEDFARRGYKAVIFARRGYASSSGASREGYGKCADANRRTYVRAAQTGAKDFAAIIEALAKQSDVDGSRVVAAGLSGGGFAASALAMNPPPGLLAIVNFAGGRGYAGARGGAKKGNCSKHGFVHAFGTFGDGASVPALWLYSTTDRLFWPELVDKAFDAYAANGAPVRLDRVGPLWFSNNGHRLVVLGARDLWRPRIDAFLDAIGAPNWETAPDDAAVARIPPPPGLGEKGTTRWRRYLALSGHKAFAQGEGSRFGWAALRDTVEDAKRAAKKFCEKGGHRCRIVSVDGAMTP